MFRYAIMSLSELTFLNFMQGQFEVKTGLRESSAYDPRAMEQVKTYAILTRITALLLMAVFSVYSRGLINLVEAAFDIGQCGKCGH